jgi:drug/metabolite transporter (DMT)-like permease
MAASLSGQMIIFETVVACLYGFIYTRHFPGAVELASIILRVGGVLWSARRHQVPVVKLDQPSC